MAFGVRLHVWGDRACFTRPELKVERVSYDVLTPSAARGILEAIHWKPAINWVVDRIHVLKPIRFQSFRRNEVGAKARGPSGAQLHDGELSGLGITVEEKRQQRATTLLIDVAYVIEAHFELTPKAASDDTEAKHLSMFNRRAENGQCFHRPCLGTREFAADFALIADGAPPPPSTLLPEQRNRDLGLMLYDIDFARDGASMFFRAHMEDGVIDLRKARAEGLLT